MEPEELKSELERLWARVSDPRGSDFGGSDPLGVSGASFAAPPLLQSHTAAQEALHILKRQHREEVLQWEELLELKEKALRELSDRLRAAESQAIELNKRLQSTDSRVLSEVTDMALKLEAAERGFKAHEERLQQEAKLLREVSEKTRQQLSGETARWRQLEREWNEREAKYLTDIHEMQERLQRIKEDSGSHESKNKRLEEDLSQAKTAIEKTLSELMNERRLRESSDQDRGKAMERVAELSEQLNRLKGIWEEERRQWQELWDRERSGWEMQRGEFQGWEERLRKEREAWHSELKSQEAVELKFADQMARTLRESSEATARIQEVLSLVYGAKRVVTQYKASSLFRRLTWAFAASVFLGVGGWYAWQKLSILEFEEVSSQSVAFENPTALAYDSAGLWASEWSGRLLALDPAAPSSVRAAYYLQEPRPYRPVSLALGGEALWSLNSSDGRILKHDTSDPTVIRSSWTTPGPAPVALAHDGRHLWSYDAVTRSAYRYLGEGSNAAVDVFPISGDFVPGSMQWVGGELWIFDAKTKRVLRFSFENRFKLLGSHDFDPLTLTMASHMSGEDVPRPVLWSLNQPESAGAAFSLKRFNALP